MFFRFRSFIIFLGLHSSYNESFTVILPLSLVIYIANGDSSPIAYDSCTSHHFRLFCFNVSIAICLALYAALLSTLVEFLHLKRKFRSIFFIWISLINNK